jgi:apolipoprotein N-acyltransferase
VTRVLALLSGVLFVASFPKFGHPAFAWIALAPLVLAVGRSTRISGWDGAFALGWLSGVVYFGGTVYWVVGVMQQYGDMPTAIAVGIGALLVLYLALFPAVFAAVLGRAVHRLGPSALWAAPAVWVATEWARGVVGSGFPWAPLGSSQATVLPVVQAASVVGVYGLSALLALVGTTAAVAVAAPGRRSRQVSLGVALLVAAVMVAGTWRVMAAELTTGSDRFRVGLVQGNVAQDQKYDPAFANEILERYLGLSRQAISAGARLVIWPEASTPFFLDAEGQKAAPIRRLAIETSTPFLIGTDAYEPARDGQPEKIFNAASVVRADGQPGGTYRKMYLVPFGEYVPLKSVLFFVNRMVEGISDFSAGTEPTVFEAGAARVSVSICYESIFPSLSRAFVAGGSELLATITNDAWFGRSSAAYQHFEQGAIRAVEEGRYVVRAANTGFSGAVDPYGRVIARSELFETAVLTVDVRLLSGRTIYSQIGDAVVWASLAGTLWLVIIANPRRRRPAAGPRPVPSDRARPTPVA